MRPAVARPKIERAELIDISLPPQVPFLTTQTFLLNRWKVREAHIQDLKDAWRTIFHTEPSKLEATTTTTGDTTPTRGTGFILSYSVNSAYPGVVCQVSRSSLGQRQRLGCKAEAPLRLYGVADVV